ncbi:chorion class high-cysteine HCB protein 13-like [Chenopodium quinoa]|uniref:chorion class high-cysteine HCB protein 13-like n=1 Tax=Chenopodium quinoa TaxID=63459 RepID=UPI000B784D18|nr:chorion class high-cysteine HCB protein 13-like [Chenopodium quinoa]
MSVLLSEKKETSKSSDVELSRPTAMPTSRGVTDGDMAILGAVTMISASQAECGGGGGRYDGGRGGGCDGGGCGSGGCGGGGCGSGGGCGGGGCGSGGGCGGGGGCGSGGC